MMELPERTVYRKIMQTGRMAEKLGANILGLGAFTSVIGDAGVTIAKCAGYPSYHWRFIYCCNGCSSHSGCGSRDGH